MVPNSQKGVFASSGFVGFWRKVQISFSDFVGFRKIARVLDSGLFSTLVFNKHLAFPIASIVSAEISSKIGFAE